jgi:peptide/nickel transport system permease protein
MAELPILPEICLAYILILLLAVKTGIFPAISIMGPETSLDERLCRSLLPALTLTLVVMAYTMRMTRAAIIDSCLVPTFKAGQPPAADPADLPVYGEVIAAGAVLDRCHSVVGS